MSELLPIQVTAKDICKAFGKISRRTLHRWQNDDPDFPKPTYIRVGAATLWDREEVLDFIELRKAKARENEQGAYNAE